MRAFLIAFMCLSLAGASLAGCEREKEEKQRELLRPVDMRQKRIDELRLVDANGELIPSGEKIAGLELPKGLSLYRSFDDGWREWYLVGSRLEMAQLDRYLTARLDPLAIERNAKSVFYKDAYLRDDPNARRISVRMTKLIGDIPTTDVYIRQAPPPRIFRSGEEAEAQIEARRKHAD
jgi:hypothetical protein